MKWLVEPTIPENDDTGSLDCIWIFGVIGGAIGACVLGPLCRSLCFVYCMHEDC